MSRHENQNVTVIRPAQEGDAGFDASKAPQSLIKLGDGSQKVVPASEVTEK